MNLLRRLADGPLRLRSRRGLWAALLAWQTLVLGAGVHFITRDGDAAQTAEDIALFLAMVGCSALGALLLIRRYDSVLMQINTDLTGEIFRQVHSTVGIRNALIVGLAKLADHRDLDTGCHLERISFYCELLARELAPSHDLIDNHWIESLQIASTMHDIGKVGVPDSILLKPGPLSAPERRTMELHALIGADTLMEVRRHSGHDDLVDMGVEIAMYHHERWYGSWYPFGLETAHIPLSARIVALADVYDALTSPRVYKEPMSHEAAREIIRSSRQTHFDPCVVDAFERVHGRFDRIRKRFHGSEPARAAA